jgi:hypothetical protein
MGKKGGALNPTDAFRKQARKKELVKNKKERTKIREVSLTYKDPDDIREQIFRLKRSSTDGHLEPQALKHLQEVSGRIIC